MLQCDFQPIHPAVALRYSIDGGLTWFPVPETGLFEVDLPDSELWRVQVDEDTARA